MPDELERLKDTLETELEAVKPPPPQYADLEFPAMIVDDLLEAGALSEDILMRRIVAAAVTIAIRRGGTASPATVLDSAKPSAPERWIDDVAPRVRRLWHRAGLTDGNIA